MKQASNEHWLNGPLPFYILILFFSGLASVNAVLCGNTQRRIAAGDSLVVLKGDDLTIDDVVKVARLGLRVVADRRAMARVRRSHELLFKAAEQGHAIYGLTRGVGENKDKLIFSGDLFRTSNDSCEAPYNLSCDAYERSRRFNRNLLLSHSAAVGPELPEEVVRAMMVVRVNSMLLGYTGCQPEIVEGYLEFLNRGIHPVVPGRGSVGVADITILSHVGLALTGAGDVNFNGQRMPAQDALAAAGLVPVQPYGKDALSIVSSNAYTAGKAALVIDEVARLLESVILVFCLSLEGFNGNMAPFIEEVQILREYPGQVATAASIRSYLTGSYLWNPDSSRALQDPLSFRDFSQVHGAAQDALTYLSERIETQLDNCEDNPAVIVFGDVNRADDIYENYLRLQKTGSFRESRERRAPALLGGSYYVFDSYKRTGMVVPTANFEPLAWVLPTQTLATSLSHVSRISCYRMLKLSTPHFSKLPRFLAPDSETIAYGTIQKTFASLDSEIRNLSEPGSVDYLPLAGNIEDHGTNAPLIVDRVAKIVDNLYYILGMELLHAAQAVDLRFRDKSGKLDRAPPLGAATDGLYKAFREKVPFLDQDRNQTEDIKQAYDFVKHGQAIKAAVSVLN